MESIRQSPSTTPPASPPDSPRQHRVTPPPLTDRPISKVGTQTHSTLDTASDAPEGRSLNSVIGQQRGTREWKVSTHRTGAPVPVFFQSRALTLQGTSRRSLSGDFAETPHSPTREGNLPEADPSTSSAPVVAETPTGLIPQAPKRRLEYTSRARDLKIHSSPDSKATPLSHSIAKARTNPKKTVLSTRRTVQAPTREQEIAKTNKRLREEICIQYYQAFPGCFTDQAIKQLYERIAKWGRPVEGIGDARLVRRAVITREFQSFCIPDLIRHFLHFIPPAALSEPDRMTELLGPSLDYCVKEWHLVMKGQKLIGRSAAAHLARAYKRLETSIISVIAKCYPDAFLQHHRLFDEIWTRLSAELRRMLSSPQARLTLRTIEIGMQINPLLDALLPYGAALAMPLIETYQKRSSELKQVKGASDAIALLNSRADLRNLLMSDAIRFLGNFSFSFPIADTIRHLFAQINDSVPLESSQASDAARLRRREAKLALVQFLFLHLVVSHLAAPSTDPFKTPIEREIHALMLSRLQRLISYTMKPDTQPRPERMGITVEMLPLVVEFFGQLADKLEPQ
ncbi:hypothetical protein [Variovorax sp. SRS16]|uniref:hypothetical protein n=1 Tax=Variovorax sp. SRS16 TaxID=282217 RepID=UPI0013A58202|nr:hypothetical protein [Variovorax sp. SRS16]